MGDDEDERDRPDGTDFADYFALSVSSRQRAARDIGRPGRLVDVGVRDTVNALEHARIEIAQLIADAPSADAALDRMRHWGPDGKTFHRLGDALFVHTVKADLAGQLMVRLQTKAAARIQLADGASKPTFLDKPWADAITEFRNRGIVKPSELSTLIRDYAQRSVVARQLMLENIQREVPAQLEKSLTEGSTYREFARAIETKKVPLGIADVDQSYLKMVFRTNVQSAYGAGRFKALTDPVVVAERPFVRYRTVGDARVRDSHRVLDGTTYRIEDEEWKRICPPNSYNCRCSAVSLTPEEVGEAKVLSRPPASYEPDPDFDRPPVARLPPEAVEQAAKGRAQAQVPRGSFGTDDAPAPVVREVERAIETASREVEQAAPPASARVGATAEKVFGRQLADDDIDELAGVKAKLPAGMSTTVDVQERRSGEVQIVVGVRNEGDELVGSSTQRITRDGDKVKATLGHLSVREADRGKSIGSRIFNAQVDAYEKHGVTEVTLDATDVGRYLWTKAGFEWDDAAQFARAVAALREQLTKSVGQDRAQSIANAMKTSQDIAELVVDGKRVGRDFLVGFDEMVSMHQTPAAIKRLPVNQPD